MRNVASPRLLLASASPARLRTLQAAGIDADVLVSGVDESAVEAESPDVLCSTLARMKAQAVAERLGNEIGNENGGAWRPPRETGQGRDTQARQRPDTQMAQGRDTLVLGCDSVLAFRGEILGKPAGPDEAVQRWRSMRGQTGVLHTGHCLIQVPAAGAASRTGTAGTPGTAHTAGTAGTPGTAHTAGTAGTTGTAHTAGAAGTETRLAEDVAATIVRFAEVTDAEIDAYVATGEPMYVAGAFTIDGIGGPFIEGVDGDPGTVIGLSLPLLRRLLARLDVRIYDLWRPAIRSAGGDNGSGTAA